MRTGHKHNKLNINEEYQPEGRSDTKSQKHKKKYIQNPKRNVITNLGNQLLALLGNKYKLN
jgi:hypothetical protein